MPRGGYRPGSGRKVGFKEKGTIEKEEARQHLRAMVIAELEPLVRAQIDNAKGLKYLVLRDKKTGKFERVTEAVARLKEGSTEERIEVWEKDPSIQAFTDLMNRAVDKPMEQPLEVDLKVKGDLLSRLIAGRKRVAEARK